MTIERTTMAASTTATAVAMSLEDVELDLGDCGRVREEMLAGNEAKEEGEGGEGGGGGEGKDGKKGEGVVEVENGTLGMGG